eukprot:m.233396 g.233396  ORF g.233396 m.233396 type:complete len:340 (-) comp18900_c0_seq2:2864-3883(-)
MCRSDLRHLAQCSTPRLDGRCSRLVQALDVWGLTIIRHFARKMLGLALGAVQNHIPPVNGNVGVGNFGQIKRHGAHKVVAGHEVLVPDAEVKAFVLVCLALRKRPRQRLVKGGVERLPADSGFLLCFFLRVGHDVTLDIGVGRAKQVRRQQVFAAANRARQCPRGIVWGLELQLDVKVASLHFLDGAVTVLLHALCWLLLVFQWSCNPPSLNQHQVEKLSVSQGARVVIIDTRDDVAQVKLVKLNVEFLQQPIDLVNVHVAGVVMVVLCKQLAVRLKLVGQALCVDVGKLFRQVFNHERIFCFKIRHGDGCWLDLSEMLISPWPVRCGAAASRPRMQIQ